MGLTLVVLAVVSGPRLDDDSYRHFARSVQALSSARALSTDLWNKPLPGLLYGVSGLLGLTAARCVAVALTVLTLHLTVELCQVFVPGAARSARWPLLMSMISQPALLRDAFVTMTEIPAACCLALSLWARLCAGRARWAALAIGLMPLCRVEMLPLAMFVALLLAFEARGRTREQLAVLALAALPSVSWYGCAALATHDIVWFRAQSYAHVRAWDLAGCVRFNVFGGLAAVLAAPSLLLMTLGALVSPRVLGARVSVLCLGALAVHYLLLNTLDVFPSGVEGVPLGHAVAAINPRNYTSSAPLAALFCAVGLAFWQDARSSARQPLMAAAGLSALMIIDGDFAHPLALARDSILLALSLAMFWPRANHVPNARMWQQWALASLTAALIMRPGFWYPTRWNDRRAAAIDALAQLARERRPARLVQDMASSLEHYAHLTSIDADWTWPHDFVTRIRDDSLVAIEVDAAARPLARYPAALTACLTTSTLVAGYDSPAQAAWRSWIDRVMARNAAVHWRAYRPPMDCTPH